MAKVIMGLKSGAGAGTRPQGVMPKHVTYQNLLEIFGEPQRTYPKGEKSRVAWGGTINNQIFIIYDYKCPDLLLTTLKGEHWHIGGFLDITAQSIIRHVTNKLKSPNQTTDELTADNITLLGVFVTIKAGDIQLQIEHTNESEAEYFWGRMRRFVKSHKVAVEHDAVEAAVRGCIAIKII